MKTTTLLLNWRQRYFSFKPTQLVVIGFLVVIIIGAILLTLPISSKDGRSLPFIDALFTATSAVCVTGLIVVDTGLQFTHFGQLVVIILIQIGGLGWMTLATLLAFVIGKRITLRERLLMQESFNQFTLSGLVRLARNVLIITISFELLGGFILSLRLSSLLPFNRALYYGIWHGISSFCNAGFDLFGEVYQMEYVSLVKFVDDPVIVLTVASLIIFGGLGFPVLTELLNWRKKCPGRQRLSLHTKIVIVTTIILLVLGTITILTFEYHNTLRILTWKGKILGSFFQSVTPRTAGYYTLPIGEMREATIFFLVILMFIGASPSSTGGGIKTSTFAVLMLAVRTVIKGGQEPRVFRRQIPYDILAKALTVTVLSLLLVIVVTTFLSINEQLRFAEMGVHFNFLHLLFEVTSAFGTVGLTAGVTPFLSSAGKLAIILTMFAGRVGPLTLAIALTHRQHQSQMKYPEDKVLIG